MKKTILIRCSSLLISWRRMIFVFVILLFAFQSILHAEIQTGSFEFDGRLREYMVYLPNNYTGSVDFPLVIHLHSGGWTAQQDMNYIKLNQVADTNGFIVVYPSAIDMRWNSGGVPAPNVDDVGFINTLIDIMGNRYSIDFERIYACGYSRGGFMAYTLACQLGHRIAAIASVSGGMSTSVAESCSPLRTMPILHIHGTADTWVPINGGSGFYSADQTLSYWTSFNDCVQVDTTTLPDLDPTDGCTVEKTTYTSCSDNCNVVYYKVINGGHTWPGAGPPGYSAGKTTQDINASVEIWNFFKNYKLVGPIPNIANAKLVACVGDSITYGYGLPNRESDCYPAQLARILQSYDIEWEMQNFGANGATLLRYGDQPYINKSVYNPALASAPEVVIIMLGSNDSWPSNWVHKDDFIPDYLALIDAFAELPSNPMIFICCPPPIWGHPWGLDGTVLKGEIIPLINEVAELRNVGVIDLHTPLEDSSHLFPDGAHPNTEGAGMIAEIVASMILNSWSLPDFNGDEFVDINDLLIMIDNWSTDNSLCDIAPLPEGDGIVDALDLDLLMRCWRQEITLPPELTLVDNEETWTTKSSMPTARYVPSVGVVDGKIYTMGGSPDSVNGCRVVEQYDPMTDTWTRKADMPMINGAAATSVVNGKIYVIGGIYGLSGTAYSSVIEYDAPTDTWTAKANMPTARAWVSSSVVNEKIYVIGGAVIAYGAPLSTVEEYDPATDTWTRKADMPTTRSCLYTSAVNGKIYAIGGSSGNPYYQGLTTVEEYDPATDTWTRKADMPTGRTYISTCAVNGKIYAVGGVNSGGADHVSQVEEYDPATDTWIRVADMPTARSGVGTCAVNGKIYAIGGWVGTASSISTVEEYNLYPLIVDFNGDEFVDIDDLVIMIDNWSTDNSLCDIAPRPFGDGTVDALDLDLLMSYWGQETTLPPELIEWKLIVDDFEQYTDDPPNEIFTTWVDGSGDPTNGATVGYHSPLGTGEHYVETTIVHNGAQSMPFFYDNTEALISEATREWDVPQDWTKEGFSELGLWFRGNPAAGSFTEGMDGTYTMTGAGADIWNNSDAFHFAYKQLSGAGSIIAKVESVDQTHIWAKAGVMIRETLDADSKHAMMIVTPASGVSFQRRTSTGGASYHSTRAGITAPRWVKIERTANGSFIASYSGNGSSWTQLGTINISMSNTVYIGLAVTSHNSGVMCEAVFSNVSIEGDVSQETWTSQDIGITSNIAEPMYVALNGNAVIYHDDPNAALIDDWTLWRIDLQDFADQGIDLASVNLMTIGFGDGTNSVAGGKGYVFFDYIGLR